MDQPSFADMEYQDKKRKTRRELFLERMDGLIPWQLLVDRIRLSRAAIPATATTTPPPSVSVPPMGRVKGASSEIRNSPTAKVAMPMTNTTSEPTKIVNHTLSLRS